MTGFEGEWDARVRDGSRADAHARRTGSRFPPVEEVLWRAARAGTLVRFFPTSSHNSLRLATSSDMTTAQDVGPCIVYRYDDPARPDRRAEYWVWDVWPQDPLRKPVLRTHDVVAAVRELERLTARLTPAAGPHPAPDRGRGTGSHA